MWKAYAYIDIWKVENQEVNVTILFINSQNIVLRIRIINTLSFNENCIYERGLKFICRNRALKSRSKLGAAIRLRAAFGIFYYIKKRFIFCDLWRKSPDFSKEPRLLSARLRYSIFIWYTMEHFKQGTCAKAFYPTCHNGTIIHSVYLCLTFEISIWEFFTNS